MQELLWNPLTSGSQTGGQHGTATNPQKQAHIGMKYVPSLPQMKLGLLLTTD